MSEKQISREQRRKAIERQKKAEKKKNKKTPGASLIKRILLTVVIIGLAGFVFGIGLFTYYASSAPDLDEELLRDPISPTFLAADGTTEIPYATAENREYIEYEDIPKVMEDAILATEDNRFYSHSGIDVIRLGGAVIANITDGFGSQGASTITQQVIKNSFLSHDKTLKRKAQEAYLAYQLEQEYEKEEIFEMYFNKILMSGNIYGFGTASEHFYGKPVSELEMHEAALLAGMPQSPNRYNPFTNPENAETRRNIVLSLMEQHEKISTEEKEQAQAASVTDSLLPEEQRPTAPTGEYTAFMEMVTEELQSLDGGFALDEGLTIYTTLEPDVQKTVNATMASDLFFDEEVESAMTVVDTETGAIRAVGAARDYSGDIRTNYATSRDRVVGSTIKPLTVYGPAVEYLDWSTGQPIVDEPYSYDSGQEIRNVDGQFLGSMTIREALYRSRNIPAVKTLKEVGAGNASDFVQNLGLEIGEVYESTALGADNISTVDMAGAFAAFGNEGIYTKPHTITKIVFRDGTTEEVVKPESVPAMKDSTAYMVTDMLRDVVNPNLSGSTGKEAAISGLDMAGKTGTSNYSEEELADYGLDSSSAPDIWFAGYTPEYSVSVWTGYPTRATGIDTASQERLLAQRLFKNVMSQISSSESGTFDKPDSVVELVVEAGTSPLKLASDYTPGYLRRSELFVRGAEPTRVSEQFIQQEPDAPTGLRADVSGNTAALSWNHSDAGDVSFEVSVETGGSRSVLTTTGNTSYSFNGLEAGGTYTFLVTAVNDGERSDPASVIVNVSAPEQPEEPEEEPADEPEEEPEQPAEDGSDSEEENPTDEENTEDSNNEGNGNNNGTGNGNNNGNNNGNGQGNNNNGSGGDGENGNQGDNAPDGDTGEEEEAEANPASSPNRQENDSADND
ncbi:penicillin-binding protein 1A [Planococcus salinus]|uniref:PBP1A family penicillin-binding protein n=1 Tax=Planococcus salinus TaxID=1848460 RepID=A0A3M8P9Z2_9BACL|nr:penicillin-binding protein 1A [Planococcus salinus]RNF40473.1 PBP1A family penicillin-binding protein [Planococcus salinus]